MVHFRWLIALLGLSLSGALFAQSVTVGSPPPAEPGDTVTVTLEWEDASGTVTGILFSVNFDKSKVASIDLANCLDGVPGFTTCVETPDGVNVGAANTDVFGDISLGSIDVTLTDTATPGVIPVIITNEDYSDASANQVEPQPNTDGQITVAAPAGGFFSSTPEAGEQLDLGAEVVGTAATPVDTLTISNASNDDFNITGFPMPPSDLTFPAVPLVVPGGGSLELSNGNSIVCTPPARGETTGTFQVAHDAAGGNSSPVEYGFVCTGLAPNVGISPQMVDLGVANQDGSSDSGAFNVSNNNDDGFSSDTEITVTAGPVQGPAGTPPAISIDPTQFELGAGAEQDVTATCEADSSTTPGEYFVVLELDYPNPGVQQGGPVERQVNCVVSEEAPGYTSTPIPGSDIDLGSAVNGATTGAQTIEIGNQDSIGDGPGSQLEVTGASISGPDASVFSITPEDPEFSLDPGAENGAASISVVCSPDAIDEFAAVLTVNSNDGDQIYNLSCEGTSNASLVVTPESAFDGTLNLGTVPPGTTTTGQLTLANAGTDPLEVSCELSNNNGSAITAEALPDGETLPPDFVINFEGTPPGIGAVEEVLSCFAETDVQSDTGAGTAPTFTTTVVVSGRPLVIPTLSQWGLLVLMLSLLLVGGFAARRVMG